jgi:hypothetical protein
MNDLSATLPVFDDLTNESDRMLTIRVEGDDEVGAAYSGGA